MRLSWESGPVVICGRGMGLLVLREGESSLFRRSGDSSKRDSADEYAEVMLSGPSMYHGVFAMLRGSPCLLHVSPMSGARIMREPTNTVPGRPFQYVQLLSRPEINYFSSVVAIHVHTINAFRV